MAKSPSHDKKKRGSDAKASEKADKKLTGKALKAAEKKLAADMVESAAQPAKPSKKSAKGAKTSGKSLEKSLKKAAEKAAKQADALPTSALAGSSAGPAAHAASAVAAPPMDVPAAALQFAEHLTDAIAVTPGFRLADLATDATPGFAGDKQDAERLLAATAGEVAQLQERLFAEAHGGGNRSLLLVVQGLDTAGKGGIMRHVVGLMDPQGVHIKAFKAPTAQERAHPFLWRIRQALPAPGMVGVFDRSHYEDVLIVRVHGLVPPAVLGRRYGQINAFEKSLVDKGTKVVKVMLHIGRDEQKARLAERLDRPDKYWKFNPGDITERRLWPSYQDAYQVMLDRTSTAEAPWHVVPADHKWYARLAVQQLLLEALREMDPQWPAADFDVEEQKAALAQS